MARTTRFSPEVRERAVRLVFEHRGQYASQWEAIGPRRGSCSPVAPDLTENPVIGRCRETQLLLPMPSE